MLSSVSCPTPVPDVSQPPRLHPRAPPLLEPDRDLHALGSVRIDVAIRRGIGRGIRRGIQRGIRRGIRHGIGGVLTTGGRSGIAHAAAAAAGGGIAAELELQQIPQLRVGSDVTRSGDAGGARAKRCVPCRIA